MNKPPQTMKAYKNLEFLNSPEARTIRILSEYLEPLRRFRRLRIHDTIVFFGSTRVRDRELLRIEYQEARRMLRQSRGKNQVARESLERLKIQLDLTRYYHEAMQLAAMLTKWANGLNRGKRFVICSGAGPGIMEAANRGATKAKGITAGLNISLPEYQPPNPYISPELLYEFHYFFMRKYWFAYMAAAMVVFPGGFGTMDELFEIVTLKQTGKLNRPLPVVIYGSKYWQTLINWNELVRLGMIASKDLELFRMCDSPEEAFEYLRAELTKHYVRGVR